MMELVRQHPLTGETFVPLMFCKDGRPVWPIMGGSEGPPEGGGSGSEGQGNGSTSGTTDSGDGTGGSGGQTGDTGETTVSRADHDALQRRMQQTDRQNSELQQKLKDIEDKDKSELDKATGRVAELEQTVTKLGDELKRLRLNNAILVSPKHTWHDPRDVLRELSEDESVSIDDDGKVSGVEAALDKLAKAKPYLLKADSGGTVDRSGDAVGSGTKTGGDSKDADAKLKQKYKIPGRLPS
jgi:Phage minor structural protein GP20